MSLHLQHARRLDFGWRPELEIRPCAERKNSADQIAVAQRIDKELPGNKVQFTRDVFASVEKTIPSLQIFLRVLVVLAAVVSALVVMLAMYTTITERTREIGILRSLGASRQFIVTLIFQESAAVCLVGVVLGIGASFLIAKAVTMMFPTLIVLITPDWIGKATVFAVLSGVIGSLYPSLKAAKQDPVEALAYE